MKTSAELAPLFDEAFAQIMISTNVLLVSPEDPDADSCTSMLAFEEFLRWLGTKEQKKFGCRLYAPERPRPSPLLKAVGVTIEEKVKTELPRHTIPDICILFDYGDFRRTRLNSLKNSHTFFLGFDHHPKSETSRFPEKNGLEIIDETPSNTALLFRFFQHVNYPIPPDVATYLLIGLIADTGRLSNSSAISNPDAFTLTGELMKLGGRLDTIYEAMQNPLPLSKFRAQQTALAERLVIDESLGLAFLHFTNEDLARWNATPEDIMPLMSRLRHIEEIRVAVIYSKLPNDEWQAGLRTNPKRGISVREIALEFGGGGHEQAAGFRSSDPPEKILEKMKAHMAKNAG